MLTRDKNANEMVTGKAEWVCEHEMRGACIGLIKNRRNDPKWCTAPAPDLHRKRHYPESLGRKLVEVGDILIGCQVAGK